MLKYVEKCMETHPGLQPRLKFLRCVLKDATEEAEKRAGGEKPEYQVWKGTKALVDLSRACAEAFIPLVDIKANAGTTGPSGGLWPWLGKVGAGVLEERVRCRVKEYRISKEFYSDFLRLFDEGVAADEHSILELQGLGKEIWNGIDAQDYVNCERSSWGG